MTKTCSWCHNLAVCLRVLTFSLSSLFFSKLQVQSTEITPVRKLNNSSVKSWLSAVKSYDAWPTLQLFFFWWGGSLDRWHAAFTAWANQACKICKITWPNPDLLVNTGLCFYCLALAWTFQVQPSCPFLRSPHRKALHCGYKLPLVALQLRVGAAQYGFTPHIMTGLRINCKTHRWLIYFASAQE